jgi:hypothetical protein
MRSLLTLFGLLLAVGLWAATPTEASAKSKARCCARAEALFLATGAGDRDGDGPSDCRERRQLGTLADDPDSDDDGSEDGEDETPGMPEQKVKAFLDAITCPDMGVPGSITALGTTATLDDLTEFENKSCEELASTPVEEAVFVEISILEDSLGALTATEVEVERDENGHDDDEDDA